MKRFFLTPAATLDLQELRQYFSTLPDGPRVRVANQIKSAFQEIASHPFIGSAQSEYSRLMGKEVRSWRVTQYRIYYLASGLQPVILAVLHTARDHTAVLRERIQ